MESIIIKGTHFSEYEAKIKLLVLSYSLRFESLASVFLCEILSIDRLSSISTGNTSNALSMNQKVQLLLDMNYFDKPDRECIKKFQEIRNKLMHDAAATSFEICLSSLTGTENVLKKSYLAKKEANEKEGGERAVKEKADEEINNMELLPFDISDKEKLLYKYYISLAEDVIKCFEKALMKLVTGKELKSK